MITISYLKSGEEWEFWKPVLYFEINSLSELKLFQETIQLLSEKDGYILNINKNSKIYWLNKLNSIKISNLEWWRILLKKSIFWNFQIQLDKIYWNEALSILGPLMTEWNWFIYLDEFKNITNLREDATIIISKRIES